MGQSKNRLSIIVRTSHACSFFLHFYVWKIFFDTNLSKNKKSIKFERIRTSTETPHHRNRTKNQSFCAIICKHISLNKGIGNFINIFCIIKFYLIVILVPGGREKIWPCKVGRDEKSLKNTGLQFNSSYN